MARRRRAEKRQTIPDLRFNSEEVALLVHKVMERGKKSVAEKIVYGAMDEIKEKLNADPVEVFKQAMENVKPRLEVKSRRVGGATYQVPVEVVPARQAALAMRWITAVGSKTCCITHTETAACARKPLAIILSA